MVRRAGLLIREKKNFKAAKALVLAFIAKEDPAHGRSSIKQRAGAPPAAPAPTDGASPLFSLPTKGYDEDRSLCSLPSAFRQIVPSAQFAALTR